MPILMVEGLGREVLPHPYQQVQIPAPLRNTDGSGLGLSIVKVIADIHGGTIKLIDNKPGLCASVIFDS